MKIYLDNFTNFVPGPSAKDLWDEIDRAGKMDIFEVLLDNCYPDGLSDTRLNDLLRFEEDWIREMLDLNDPDEDEDEDETVTSREVDCPCDCSDCEWTDKCSENGRYDLSDGDEEDDDDLLTDLHAEQNEQQ